MIRVHMSDGIWKWSALIGTKRASASMYRVPVLSNPMASAHSLRPCRSASHASARKVMPSGMGRR